VEVLREQQLVQEQEQQLLGQVLVRPLVLVLVQVQQL
jgi:hypothetical protein